MKESTIQNTKENLFKSPEVVDLSAQFHPTHFVNCNNSFLF